MNIAPVREPKNSESKSDDVHLQLLQTFLAIKHRRIFNVDVIPLRLHVDVEELRAQASDSMLGDLLPSQMGRKKLGRAAVPLWVGGAGSPI